jgi:hypothetical protein
MPSRHLLLNDAGAEVLDVAVWNAVSLFLQTIVLLTPITRVIVRGLYPKSVVLPDL